MDAQTGTDAQTKEPWIPIGQMKKIKIPNVSKTISASPLAAGLICQVYVCGCMWEKASERDGPVRPLLSDTTTGDGFGIIRHIHYSTGHEYQRDRREEKAADGQPATTSPIYPITQSVSTDRLPHITGPNISLRQRELRTASLSLPHPLSLLCFLSFHLFCLSRNSNTFIFPSYRDLEDLTSGLTGNISKQLLKMKTGFVKRCSRKEKIPT